MKPEDIVSTLTHFTARSIGVSYRKFVLPAFDIMRVVFSGGGTLNRYMMDLIREDLSPVVLNTSDEFGVPSAAREAMSFAILAHETLRGRPSNVPSATGASREVVLGSVTVP